MADVDESVEAIDGRVARRQRNINAVLDEVLAMFAEEAMFPTMEQAASRSGLSLRSLYRYFADPGELLEAAIRRSHELTVELVMLPGIGTGSLADRIDDFVAMRLRLFEAKGAAYRATVANAARHPRVRTELDQRRRGMRKQFELQFAPELAQLDPAEADAVVGAGDALTQLGAIDYLCRDRGLSGAEAAAAVTVGLRGLLGSD